MDEFLLAELPAPPARVLEVGCGAGELAKALAGAGYDVVAIDPKAPAGPLFRRTTIEELDEPGSFDAVVASSSLHHVHDLPAALDKIAGLLAPGGTLAVDEFAWERLDAKSAAAVGLDHADWHEEHRGLHTSEAMIPWLDERFTRRTLTREPYLFREAHAAVTEEEERNLIRTKKLREIGFRFVGTR
ncbi:MAG TPA: class I SAM-dependent methyltransferase [Gaiellaceae bacterium]|nr:class I SAM-dependent methyltransferase [Gaiellaceae bacterium]